MLMVTRLLTDIRQDHRILNLIVLCEQKDFGDDLCCLGIVIRKGQEYLSAML